MIRGRLIVSFFLAMFFVFPLRADPDSCGPKGFARFLHFFKQLGGEPNPQTLGPYAPPRAFREGGATLENDVFNGYAVLSNPENKFSFHLPDGDALSLTVKPMPRMRRNRDGSGYFETDQIDALRFVFKQNSPKEAFAFYKKLLEAIGWKHRNLSESDFLAIGNRIEGEDGLVLAQSPLHDENNYWVLRADIDNKIISDMFVQALVDNGVLRWDNPP